jgi:menaquinone-dependent protoporphyrinogen oxidase
MREALTVEVLVAYASKHGSTAEIAEAVAAEIREHGLGADCVEAGAVDDVERYDAVILGSAVYMKRWQGDARHFLRSHRKALAERPFWVFSSGPTGDPAEDNEAWEEPKRTIAKAEKLGARDHVVFGGRISPESGRMAKAMVEGTPEEYRDRRDWEQIRGWAAGIADELAAA